MERPVIRTLYRVQTITLSQVGNKFIAHSGKAPFAKGPNWLGEQLIGVHTITKGQLWINPFAKGPDQGNWSEKLS